MKIWWVLAWEQYYPNSGLGNVYATFADEYEARQLAADLERDGDHDHVKVVNIQEEGLL